MKANAIASSMLLVLVPALIPMTHAADTDPGEFAIPDVLPLDEARQTALQHLAATDPEARALADTVREAARPLADHIPQPLVEIHYEGLVNTDPRRIATVAKLREMGDTARLVRWWQLDEEPAAAALERLLLAWSGTYRPTGNDVNENKFFPLLVARLELGDQLPASTRRQVDAWLTAMGEIHATILAESTHYTNRYTKRLRMLTLLGRILHRPEWTEAAEAGIRRFVSESLYAGGSSRDFQHRDTLTYHGSALKPLIDLAILAGDNGPELYRWTGENGGSIAQSVEFVVPYARGEKIHREWVHSKVGLDRRRAEAGLEKYQPGRPYDPKQARELFERAAYFDASLVPLVLQLDDSAAERFPTWRMLVNAAARAGS